ncbi:TetR family transcriptional regulator [Alcanivorax sp. HI0083]|uniref:TetR/AcrR family transcriptional regulator n=1 Tax=unclassified Alcanivorax TaxID=2638842 RepID=UPI0007B9F8B3|nr:MULTISPECIES: TetR/AcrR family transcriptional regulator [unclassified Alcanivorax]KZY28582.1 TetR family transcriptional regulator [Alcanivorax sp. HI0044]KZZ27038.1 TetR family transcriptional regulator [Alcanivorax sp. HI0083]PHR64261.1 MAG: TetR/AcrR family transcriptional regulator [Alcanivorax sp.]
MARKPKQQRSKATVDAIVEAALIAIAQQGPSATTARQVADIAGIGVGSLYEYFEDKDAIFEAAGARFVDDTVAMIKPLIPELVRLNIRDAVAKLLFTFRDFLEENNQLYLKCARHAFSLDMVIYQEPINRALMDLFTQYLMHHPDMLRLPNIPALAYFYINGGVFTVVRHLSEQQPTQGFDELVTVFGDILASYAEHKLGLPEA